MSKAITLALAALLLSPLANASKNWVQCTEMKDWQAKTYLVNLSIPQVYAKSAYEDKAWNMQDGHWNVTVTHDTYIDKDDDDKGFTSINFSHKPNNAYEANYAKYAVSYDMKQMYLIVTHIRDGVISTRPRIEEYQCELIEKPSYLN